MDSRKRLVVNKGTCPSCKETIQSKYRNDFVTCSCGRSTLDGGLDMIRTIGATISEPLFSDDDYEEIRKYHCRGGRGKTGVEELKWVPLAEMSDAWLIACVGNGTEGLNNRDTPIHRLYEKELEYRKENEIFIKD